MVAEVIPSVFVDEEFIPFDDQWVYLSSVKKLSEKAVQTCCIELRKAMPNFLSNDFDESETIKVGIKYKISGTYPNSQSNNLNRESNNSLLQSAQLTQKDFPPAVRITFSNQQPRRRASGHSAQCFALCVL